MTFDYPYAFAAFAIFIPFALFDIFGHSRKYKNRLADGLVKKLRSSVFLYRLFVVLAIIAMAGPRWGTGLAVSEYRRGLDAVFAIDVSRSMDIRDAHSGGSQSRLERGLLISKQSIANVTGARFAAAIGRGRGVLAVPLTWDNDVSLSFLESLDTSAMIGRSTNLEALLEAAADAFQISSPARKVIVLVSDGEAHYGVIRNAINRCVKEGIIVNALALGSDEGRPVPYESAIEDSGEDRQSAVISRRDSAVMRMAAERTGGVYIDGSRDDAGAVLAARLLPLAQESGAGRSLGETKQRRALFIILALLAYCGSKLASRSFSRLPLVSIIAVVFTFTSCAEGSFSAGRLLLMEASYLHSRGRYDEAIVPYLKALNYKEASPYAEYGLGLAFYSLDEGNAALKRFDSSKKMLETLPAAEHRELRYRNSYNSGIVFFEDGDFNSAAAAFKDALRADPAKIDAKRNLELSLLSIAKDTSRENNGGERQENETREILFEFIRQQEQQKWKSTEWTPEEKFTGPDY